MEAYKARHIRFKDIVIVDGWQVKVYTISKTKEFDHPNFYKDTLLQLPNWLAMDNGFANSNQRMAFLILHAGSEGIFSLVNWWVGDNMLNTNIFLSASDKPYQYTKISGSGLAPCIWELEVINHERLSWTEHVLKRWNDPDFGLYLSDVVNRVM